MDPKKSSVKTFVDNLAKADKLLNDENIKNICNTKDTVGSEVIQKILKVYTTLVKVINDQTLTKQIVDGSADGLKKYVNLANKIICQHAIWRIE